MTARKPVEGRWSFTVTLLGVNQVFCTYSENFVSKISTRCVWGDSIGRRVISNDEAGGGKSCAANEGSSPPPQITAKLAAP